MLTNIFNTPSKNAKKELEAELEKQRQKQKELENAPSKPMDNPFKKYKSVTTKDTLIKIDNFNFRVSQNIESITTTLAMGIKKIETIKKPIYQRIGGNEESISFDTRILVNDLSEYEGFKELIKKAKPLKLVILSEPPRKILIQRLSESKKNWILTSERGVSYYCKELSIEGVILLSLEKDLSKAIQKTLNKTISKLAKEQTKLIKQDYDIDVKKIKSMTRIQKATSSNLTAKIKSLDTPISLKHFKKAPVMSAKKVIGVNVKINKSSKVFLKGHFIGKSKTRGGEFIALRENSKHNQNPSFNYKISSKSYPSYSGATKLLYPLSLKSFSQIAKSKSEVLQRRAKEIFAKELGL